MIKLWYGQIVSAVRLELKKTFFSKRGLWIYLLAFAPVALYIINSAHASRERQRLVQLAIKHPVSQGAFYNINNGLSRDQVIEKLGEPTRANNLKGTMFYHKALSFIIGRYSVLYR